MHICVNIEIDKDLRLETTFLLQLVLDQDDAIVCDGNERDRQANWKQSEHGYHLFRDLDLDLDLFRTGSP